MHLTCVFAPSLSTGKERNSESGNDYFGARYYASSMGRFLSPDPSQSYHANPTNPQSFNLYSYGQDNPLINIDPTGLDCIHINVDTGVFEAFETGGCDWDGPVLSEHLRQHYKVDLGVRQCQRIFRQIGFRLRKPRPPKSLKLIG